jgi:hypothetical protein
VASVDRIKPRAELLPITNGGVVRRGSILTFRGRAVDAHLKRYRITATGPDGDILVAESETPVWSGNLGTWSTAGVTPATYRVTLLVEDRSGNVASAEIPVTIEAETPVVTSVAHAEGAE